MGDEWLGVPAIARFLGVYLRTVYKLIDQGEIPAYKIGRRPRRRVLRALTRAAGRPAAPLLRERPLRRGVSHETHEWKRRLVSAEYAGTAFKGHHRYGGKRRRRLPVCPPWRIVGWAGDLGALRVELGIVT